MNPDSRPELQREDLDGLFPRGVACTGLQDAAAAGALLPEEAAAATRFVPARLNEFRLGRACARRALLSLGASPAAIGVGTHREPLWPAGIVGSISHASGMAAAAVARAADFAAIGLDIETAAALDPALIAIVCRPEEVRRLRATGTTAGAQALLVFSAKEAVYKTLWPRVRRFIGFQDVAITVDAMRGEFRVTARTAGCPAPLAQAIRGRFTRRAGLVVTAAWIEAGDSRPASADV